MADLFLTADMGEARKRQKLREQPSVTVNEIIMQVGAESTALSESMIDGRTGDNWIQDDQSKTMTHQRDKKGHMVRMSADDGEEVAHLHRLVREQSLDSVIVLMYVLTCLSPDLDPSGSCRAWIDTAEAAKQCGLLPTETKEAKRHARERVTSALAYGERATVIGRRRYPDSKTKSEASQIHSAYWAITDVEYLDKDLDQQGLPSTGRRLPIDPMIPPVRVFVVLSNRMEELITDPEWRQYLVGLRAVARIPAGKPSGQIARAVGLAFMTRAKIESKRAAADIRAVMNSEEPSQMIARERRWWLENFGIDTKSKTYKENPARLLEHWAQALELLSRREEEGGAEIIARIGEASSACASMERPDNRQGWLDEWLGEKVRFTPGAALAGRILMFDKGEQVPVGVARAILNKRGRPSTKPAPPRFTKLPTVAPQMIAAEK